MPKTTTGGSRPKPKAPLAKMKKAPVAATMSKAGGKGAFKALKSKPKAGVPAGNKKKVARATKRTR